MQKNAFGLSRKLTLSCLFLLTQKEPPIIASLRFVVPHTPKGDLPRSSAMGPIPAAMDPVGRRRSGADLRGAMGQIEAKKI